jgi:WD40 repeat protein
MLKFSPNSEVMAVAYCPPTSTIVLYSTKTWKAVKEVKGLVSRVKCMDFSVDGKYVQVNTSDNRITYFNVSSGA